MLNDNGTFKYNDYGDIFDEIYMTGIVKDIKFLDYGQVRVILENGKEYPLLYGHNDKKIYILDDKYVKELEDLKRLDKETKERMKDVDPYEEEDWLKENVKVPKRLKYCHVCGKDTLTKEDDYALRNEFWHTKGVGVGNGVLCLDCLIKRFKKVTGRDPMKKDFLNHLYKGITPLSNKINERVDLIQYEPLVKKIQSVLTKDLLKGMWNKVFNNPLAGHCYAATEALYWMLGGTASDWKTYVLSHLSWPEGLDEGETHWFMKNSKGEVLDPTAGQFEGQDIAYDKGRYNSMMNYPKGGSKRAREIMRRVAALNEQFNPNDPYDEEQWYDVEDIEFKIGQKLTCKRDYIWPTGKHIFFVGKEYKIFRVERSPRGGIGWIYVSASKDIAEPMSKYKVDEYFDLNPLVKESVNPDDPYDEERWGSDDVIFNSGDKLICIRDNQDYLTNGENTMPYTFRAGVEYDLITKVPILGTDFYYVGKDMEVETYKLEELEKNFRKK